MDTGQRRSDLAHRQAVGQACVKGVENDFMQPGLLGDCEAGDFNCLCELSGPGSFAGWYLNGICTRCDIIPGVQVDPISALGELCSDQATLRAGDFTCMNFTPHPTIDASTPTTASTTRVLSPVPLSPSSSQPPSTTITGAIATFSPPVHPSFSNANATTRETTRTIPDHTTTSTFDPAAATNIPVPLSSTRQKSGLSTGAKAGIGVAAGVAGIFLLFAILFLCRRRTRKAGWNTKGVNTRELYGDDGVNSAYALNGGPHYTESPIGTAITTEHKSQLGPSGFAPVVREVYMDEEEDTPSPNEGRIIAPDSRPASDAYFNNHPLRDSPPASEAYFNGHPLQHDSRPASQTAVRALNTSDFRPLSNISNVSATSPTLKTGVIPRKEVASPTPPPAYPANLPRTIYSPSPTHNRSESGTQSRSESRLRGPVPEMYAFGGEEIANDEELERLEEEERRIDDAIRESERLERMREEREVVRKRIEEGRRQRESL